MVGYHKAAEMILLGEPFDAAAAVASGIANAICPDESVLATALATARKLAAKPPSSLKLSKRSEEHTSELPSLMRISYAGFCSKKKTSWLITNIIRHRTRDETY